MCRPGAQGKEGGSAAHDAEEEARRPRYRTSAKRVRAVALQAGSAAGWRSARDRASHRETCKDDSLRRDACAAHTTCC